MEQLKNSELADVAILFDFDIVLSFALLFCALILCYAVFRINTVDYGEDMEAFINLGGDKSSDEDFEKFRRTRRFGRNAICAVLFAALAAAYAAFLGDVL